MVGKNLVDSILERYDIPAWVKPYVYDYIKKNPAAAIRYATSFIEVKRKKGEVTGSYVKLPNGVEFDKESVVHILSLFYYGEGRAAHIYNKWAREPVPDKKEYQEFYAEMAGTAERHARAIKNLIEGIGHKPDAPSEEAVAVFDQLESIEDWKERMISTNIIIRYSYGVVFGVAFYKAFYFVMPEYMRTFGKAFQGTTEIAQHGENATREILRNGYTGDDAIRLFEGLMEPIIRSVIAEVHIAKKAKIEREIELLCSISIAYPLTVFREEGLNIDVKGEVAKMGKLFRERKNEKHRDRR